MTERTSGEARRAKDMQLSQRVRSSPPEIYINHYAGEGGQWFLHRHGTKYVRAYDLAGMQARAERAEAEVERLRQRVDVYDAFATRNAVLEEAARAVEGEPPTVRDWVPGSLYNTLRREAAAAIRALKT